MNDLIFLGLIAGIAVAASLFLATYFFFVKTKDSFKNRLLGFLFMAIGLRIGKSIAFFIFESMVPIGLAIGYLGLACIGPFLFFYVRSSVKYPKQLLKTDMLHAIIPVIGIVICLITDLYTTTILYRSTTGLLLVYIVMSFVQYKRKQYRLENIRLWNIQIMVVVSVVWGAFVYQHVTAGIADYAMGAGLASLPIYYIFIYALKWPMTNNKSITRKFPKDCLVNVRNAFEQDAIFTKTGITLAKFSEENNIPSYIATNAVKELYGKSFPETVNHFRVEALKEKLQNADAYNTKIEILAYEVGFNSPSVFYTEFKKSTGLSPSRFKETHHSVKKLKKDV